MESQSEQILMRLHRVFDGFLQKNFVNQSNVYFEKLLSHLSAKENAYVLHEPLVIDWVNKCIDAVQADFKSVHPKVITFMLKFASLLASNEWTIIMIREHKIMDRVLRIVEEHMHEFNPSIKLGCIRLLSGIAQNSLGLAYIRTARAWRCLIDYCNNDHTLYVVREARQLLYELLYKFNVKTKDESLVIEILGEILKPLLENVYEEHNGSIHIIVEDGEVQHKLSATLDLVSFIFQKTLETEDKNNLIHLCVVHYDFSEISIWKISEMAKNPYFMGKILTAITSINFSRLVYEKWECGEIAPENFNTFGLCFFNTMKLCITTGDSINFLKLAELNHLLWKRLGPRAPKEILIENDRVRFENQLITFHVIPVLFILKSKDIQQEELFDDFITKLIHISCEQTHRICYGYRDVLYNTEQMSPSLVCDLACKSIHSILSMENKLDRDQAVLVFQSMIYALKELTMKTNEDVDNIARGTTCPLEQLQKVLYSVLIGLQTLIERYRISWKESIETICLVNCVGWLLENSNLSSRLAVQALKLMQVSIEHFLSPNMALLVNNLQGSGLVRLGPIIVKRVHDNAWEVRDSTVELVTSIAEISRCKFPAFQQFLAEQNICTIVYQMAQHDCEAYVRASAFKCLTNFVTINLIWENELKKLDIIEHLFSVLYNESEGIVRKEAVATLSKIYDHRKIPYQHNDTFYSILTHCTVADLHWEVKVNALRFWELEIQRQFTHQGMIDGTFPTVTFSKEHKKIVTLTEKEINLRIIKAFNELSQRGCLGVILNCLKEDYDLEVVKTAVCVVHRLFEMLNKYNYESVLGNLLIEPTTPQTPSPSSNENEDKNDIPIIYNNNEENNASFEEIIEDILDAQDINLLVAACEKQLNLNGDANEKRHINDSFYRQYAKVTTKDFITTVKTIDFEKLLKKHQEWHLSDQSFISLLDDIVCAINPDDVEIIFADCY